MKTWIVVGAVAMVCATYGGYTPAVAQGLGRADRGASPGFAAQREAATRDREGASGTLSDAGDRRASGNCPQCAGVSGSPAPNVGTSPRPANDKKRIRDDMDEAKRAGSRCAKGWRWVEHTNAKAQAYYGEATGRCVRWSDLDDPRK